ncbi:MAG: chemotaxis protein CheW [Deltaproteobacteria bacterium]|nr:chemotaxis protein CheW [Deltaproteobacteria bacterium]
MSDLDLELVEEFVVESRELLEAAESDLLALDLSQGAPGQEVVNRIFRAVHSVKGAAGFFGLEVIGVLAHRLESVLMKVRDGQLAPTSQMVDVLLQANDRLRGLLEDIQASNGEDVSAHLAALDPFLGEGGSPPAPPAPPAPAVTAPAPQGQGGGSFAGWSVPAALAAEIKRHGRHLFGLTVDPSRDLIGQGRTAAALIEDVSDLGELLHSTYDEATPGGSFALVVSTVLDLDFAVEGFALPRDAIQDLLRASVVAPAPPAAPPPLPKAAPAAAPPNASAVAASPAAAKASPAAAKASSDGGSGAQVETKSTVSDTIRIKTTVLNALMEMAGELVLARNRLLRTLADKTDQIEGLGPVLSQVSSITTEVQEQIMRTRLQPVGTLFGRFNRVVRDLTHKLGKEVNLETVGADVELDRTILEGLADPLTHLLRNSLDHGIEMPEERVAAGKVRFGTIQISAQHEGGMVNITIKDDGGGIDVQRILLKAMERGLLTEEQADRMSDREGLQLIFLPGFSTAKVVTDVSGRGVGMDVVRTNIEKLGGNVDLASTHGVGTTVTLKLPLTLAIVSSLIVTAGGQHFALPQVGLQEVIRIVPGQGHEAIEEVRGASVLRHRGTLLPIVRLDEVLDIAPTFVDPQTGARRSDRRQRIADRRQSSKPRTLEEKKLAEQRAPGDRRESLASVQRILVLKVGKNRFGLLVDQIVDNEEIVVKPVSRFVRSAPCFSGATILGDGTISMILDPLGISTHAKLRFDLTKDKAVARPKGAQGPQGEIFSLILLSNHTDETFALPLTQVGRIEKIRRDEIRRIGDREYLSYRETTLPLVRLEQHLRVKAPATEPVEYFVVIPNLRGQQIGLLTTQVLDAVEVKLQVHQGSVPSRGIFGSAVLDDRIVLLLDIVQLAQLSSADGEVRPLLEGITPPLRVVLVEASPTTRLIQRTALQRAGALVTVAEDVEAATALLKRGGVDALILDGELPNQPAEVLLSDLRADESLARLPVILTTSHLPEDEEDSVGRFAARAAKLDIERLVERLITFAEERR